MLLAGVRSSESRKAATDWSEMLEAGAPGGRSSPIGGTAVPVVDAVESDWVSARGSGPGSVTGSGTDGDVLVDVGATEVVVEELLGMGLVGGVTVVTVADVGGVDVGTCARTEPAEDAPKRATSIATTMRALGPTPARRPTRERVAP